MYIQFRNYVDEQFPTLIFPKSDFVRLGAGETGLLAEGAAQPAAVEQLRSAESRARSKFQNMESELFLDKFESRYMDLRNSNVTNGQNGLQL